MMKLKALHERTIFNRILKHIYSFKTKEKQK